MTPGDRRARVGNLVRVRDSYVNREVYVNGYPPLLMIEPSSCCTCACPLCPVTSGRLRRSVPLISFDSYRRLLEGAYPYVCSLNLWNYGEPFLHPHIVDMIEVASQMSIETVCSTNGFWLSTYSRHQKERVLESGLDTLIIALDGASAETHGAYRVGSDFSALTSHIAELIHLRKCLQKEKPSIEIQFVVMKHNVHEMEAATELARRVRVDRLTFKSVNLMIGHDPYTSDESSADLEFCRNSHRYLPPDPTLHRYASKPDSGTVDHDCQQLWQMLIVNSDGKAAVCCRDFNGSVVDRTVFSESLMSIWNSPEYARLRRQILTTGRTTSMLCRYCTEGVPSVVKVIQFGEHSAHYLKQNWLEQRIQEESRHLDDTRTSH